MTTFHRRRIDMCLHVATTDLDISNLPGVVSVHHIVIVRTEVNELNVMIYRVNKEWVFGEGPSLWIQVVQLNFRWMLLLTVIVLIDCNGHPFLVF